MAAGDIACHAREPPTAPTAAGRPTRRGWLGGSIPTWSRRSAMPSTGTARLPTISAPTTRPGARFGESPDRPRQPRVPPQHQPAQGARALRVLWSTRRAAPRLLHLPARGLARGGAELGRARLRQELVEVAKRLLSSLLRPPKPPGALAAQADAPPHPQSLRARLLAPCPLQLVQSGALARAASRVPNPLQGRCRARAVGPLAQLRALRADGWTGPAAAPRSAPVRGRHWRRRARRRAAAARPRQPLLRPQPGFRGCSS